MIKYPRYMVIIFISVAVSMSLSGCLLWPYKSDFDCKMPEGNHCMSLYRVNSLIDQGYYNIEDDSVKCVCRAAVSKKKERFK